MDKNYLDLIEDTLHSLFPTDTFIENAAKYLIFAPSKRIRPLLTLAATNMLKGDINQAVIPACSLEIIHTYSLIHDDLPCMDNDDERRGKPTLHKCYDEATALLTGDYLLTYAFDVILKTKISDKKKLLLTQALNKASLNMVEGQLLDWQESQNKKEIDLKKTAALFSCAFQFAAIISDQSTEEFSKIGETIGLLFQLADDIQDNETRYTEDVEKLSKEVFLKLEPYNSHEIKSLVEKIVFSCRLI